MCSSTVQKHEDQISNPALRDYFLISAFRERLHFIYSWNSNFKSKVYWNLSVKRIPIACLPEAWRSVSG